MSQEKNNKATVLILHGIMGYAGWQESLKSALENIGIKVFSPALPDPGRPIRSKWVESAMEIINSIDNLENLIIVGHSLGVTLALDLLEIIDNPIKALISVSGFSDDYGAELNSYYLQEKHIDFNKVISKAKKRIVIYGENDPYVPQEILKKLSKDINSDEEIFIENGGHLSKGNGFIEFPLLVDLIVENS